MCLEPFLEGGETVSVSDGELIPPLGGQTGEELVLGPGGLEHTYSIDISTENV